MLLSLVNKLLYCRHGFFRGLQSGWGWRGPLGGEAQALSTTGTLDKTWPLPVPPPWVFCLFHQSAVPPFPAVLPLLPCGSGGAPRQGLAVPEHQAPRGLYSSMTLGPTAPECLDTPGAPTVTLASHGAQARPWAQHVHERGAVTPAYRVGGQSCPPPAQSGGSRGEKKELRPFAQTGP